MFVFCVLVIKKETCMLTFHYSQIRNAVCKQLHTCFQIKLNAVCMLLCTKIKLGGLGDAGEEIHYSFDVNMFKDDAILTKYGKNNTFRARGDATSIYALITHLLIYLSKAHRYNINSITKKCNNAFSTIIEKQ